MIPDLPALSIRQPWAWLIVRPDLVTPEERLSALAEGLLKDLENRKWGPRQPGRPQNFRGEFLIHAALGCTPDEYSEARDVAESIGVTLPAPSELDRGGIIGMAEVTDWVIDSASPWFFGPGALLLRNARPLPFTPCRGALGFFKPELPRNDQPEPDLFSLNGGSDV